MPSFKIKSTKKPQHKNHNLNNNSISLDTKHNEFILQFANDENVVIPRLIAEQDELKDKIYSHDPAIDELILYKDRCREISRLIKDLESKKMNYYLSNSKYIFEYFENKKSIASQEKLCNQNAAVNSFFKIKPTSHTENIKNENIFQNYLCNIDESCLNIEQYTQPELCQSCNEGELIAMDDVGVMICVQCGSNFQYLIENEKPSYKEPQKEICFYAYKKINHFKEILSQFQGKETTYISDEIIDQIRLQIRKERICIRSLSYYKTKDLLKKLGFNKYYEHINYIKNKLGISSPIISQQLEESLCNAFMEIQYPYAKHCPGYRVNFLHYYFVLYKLLELFEERSYLSEIPMLKDREKLIEQDIIWKKICDELKWEFNPTV